MGTVVKRRGNIVADGGRMSQQCSIEMRGVGHLVNEIVEAGWGGRRGRVACGEDVLEVVDGVAFEERVCWGACRTASLATGRSGDAGRIGTPNGIGSDEERRGEW